MITHTRTALLGTWFEHLNTLLSAPGPQLPNAFRKLSADHFVLLTVFLSDCLTTSGLPHLCTAIPQPPTGSNDTGLEERWPSKTRYDVHYMTDLYVEMYSKVVLCIHYSHEEPSMLEVKALSKRLNWGVFLDIPFINSRSTRPPNWYHVTSRWLHCYSHTSLAPGAINVAELLRPEVSPILDEYISIHFHSRHIHSFFPQPSLSSKMIPMGQSNFKLESNKRG